MLHLDPSSQSRTPLRPLRAIGAPDLPAEQEGLCLVERPPGGPGPWPTPCPSRSLAASTVLPTWAWQAGREAAPLHLDTRGRNGRPDLLSFSPLCPPSPASTVVPWPSDREIQPASRLR